MPTVLGRWEHTQPRLPGGLPLGCMRLQSSAAVALIQRPRLQNPQGLTSHQTSLSQDRVEMLRASVCTSQPAQEPAGAAPPQGSSKCLVGSSQAPLWTPPAALLGTNQNCSSCWLLQHEKGCAWTRHTPLPACSSEAVTVSEPWTSCLEEREEKKGDFQHK